MSERQQILYLWLAESALDTEVVGWAFYDGSGGTGPPLPEAEPPYRTGLAALEAGWFMLQSPAPYAMLPGVEHETSYLPNEFVFERRVVLD
jgi:hypothetical protein